MVDYGVFSSLSVKSREIFRGGFFQIKNLVRGVFIVEITSKDNFYVLVSFFYEI